MVKWMRNCQLLLVLIVFLATSQAYGDGIKNIIVLHSYHKGLEWADTITRGIQSVVDQEETDVEVYFEYLETKRHRYLGYTEQQVALFMSKYPAGLFDVIIVADNNALKFIRRFGKTVFPNTPVVFCGINNFSPELISGIDMVTGIVGTTGYNSTLELMAKFHPNARNVFVIIDQSAAGLEIKKDFQKVAPLFQDRFTFKFYQDFLLEEIGPEISRLGAEDLIYLLTFNRDRNKNFISYSNGIKLLSDSSHRPVYGSWDFHMGKGIVGGVITSGFEQGKLAAGLALDVISGAKTQKMPIITSAPNQCMLDYNQLKRFGIKMSEVPANCIVINTPPTFYTKYKKVTVLSSFLAILISGILIWNFRIQKQKQALLVSVNEELDKHVKEKTIELIETSEKLNKIINTAPSPVFYKDKEGRYGGCNDAFADNVIGLPKDKIVGYTVHEMPDRIPTKMAYNYHQKDAELIQTPGTQFYEAKVKCADDQYRDFIFNKATLFDVDGNVSGIVGVMLDISDRKKVEEALVESKERFKMLLDASFGGIIIHDKGQIIDVNQGLSEMTGYSYEELLQFNGFDLIAPKWREKAIQKVMSGDETLYDIEGVKKDGTIFPLEIQAKTIPYEGRFVRVTGLRDISERRQADHEREILINELQAANKQLTELSMTDALTGLNNRRYIFERLAEEITKSERYGNSLSIILIDIDNFKNLNDTYGHPFGDSVLKKSGQVFKETIRGTDMVGRYGGEEFLFVLANASLEHGYLLAERIRKNIETLTWNNSEIRVTISGGLVQFNGESRKELLTSADALLYKAKSLGKNRIER